MVASRVVIVGCTFTDDRIHRHRPTFCAVCTHPFGTDLFGPGSPYLRRNVNPSSLVHLSIFSFCKALFLLCYDKCLLFVRDHVDDQLEQPAQGSHHSHPANGPLSGGPRETLPERRAADRPCA